MRQNGNLGSPESLTRRYSRSQPACRCVHQCQTDHKKPGSLQMLPKEWCTKQSLLQQRSLSRSANTKGYSSSFTLRRSAGDQEVAAHDVASLTFTRIHRPHHSGVTVPCFTASSCTACELEVFQHYYHAAHTYLCLDRLAPSPSQWKCRLKAKCTFKGDLAGEFRAVICKHKERQ